MLNKLFPSIEYEKIKYDKEGLYSITNYVEADIISNLIKNLFIDTNNLSILDGTGGIGGNTISFGKFFNSVTSIEINTNRYEMLKNNIKLFNLQNVKLLNLNSIDYLFSNYEKYNIYFFDPPWGGLDYKKNINLKLKMNNFSLNLIVDKLKELTTNKVLLYKLPFNYDFTEFNSHDYKLYKINKYYIIAILI